MNPQFEQMLAELWKGGTYGYYLSLPYPHTYWMRADNPKDVPNVKGKNLYFGVHPCYSIPPVNADGEVCEPQDVRARIEFVEVTNCLFAEFDAKNENKPQTLARVNALKIKPSILIDSGGGYHAYWLLTAPFRFEDDDDREMFSHLQARWVEFVGSDKQSKDLARVLRIPETHNFKYDPAPLVQFVQFDLSIRYSVTQLRSVLPRLQTQAVPQTAASSKAQLKGIGERLVETALRKGIGRNASGFWLATQLRDAGLAQSEAEAYMLSYVSRAPKKDHAYTVKEARASLNQAYKKSARLPLPPLQGESK